MGKTSFVQALGPADITTDTGRADTWACAYSLLGIVMTNAAPSFIAHPTLMTGFDSGWAYTRALLKRFEKIC